MLKKLAYISACWVKLYFTVMRTYESLQCWILFSWTAMFGFQLFY